MSLNCSKCGATLKRSAKFCTVCGTATAESETPTSSTTPSTLMKCTTCGKPLKAGTKFCTKCGSTVEPTAAPAQSSSAENGCPHCGFDRNPVSSNFCINCGQTISASTPAPQESPAEQSASGASPSTCSSCRRESKPGSKFCIYCGGQLTTAAETVTTVEASTASTTATPVTAVEPITVPTKVLASLMARGRQLTLEEEYAKNGVDSDELFEELSQAAGDSDFELEELIDSYINERSELERLEALQEKGEVSLRVYERLSKEYEEKLESMDEQIITGVQQLHGYKAQIQLDHAEAKEELETIKARLLIGDEEAKDVSKKEKLSEKADRLSYALLASDHILKKESVMRNGPITRFEVTETTVADSKVTKIEPEEVEVIKPAEKPKESKPEPSASPSPPPDAEAGKICAQCGRVTASDAKFCIHCAASL